MIIKKQNDNRFHIANVIDFTSSDVRSALDGVTINSFGKDKLYSTYSVKANTGFYIPITLDKGNYHIKAAFVADGTNNVRIFDSEKNELIRLSSNVGSKLTVLNDNTLYYIRLYYQAQGSSINISSFDFRIIGDEDYLKENMIPKTYLKNTDVFDKLIGIIATNDDFVNPSFLDNSGIISTSSSYSPYALSKELNVNVGDIVYIPYTYTALNTQLGGYYKNGVWVANLGSHADDIIDNFYSFELRTDIDYDSIRVNVYVNGTNHDYTTYANVKEPHESKLFLLDNIAIKSKEVSIYHSKWNNKNWVALGDSWTEGAYADICGRYTDYVKDSLGLNLTNLGVGGTGVEKFAEQINKPLTQEIASSADLITIWGSINNMAQGGANCGTLDDLPSSSGTLMARWKYTIEKVLTLNPMTKIVIIGCPPSFHSSWTGYNAYNSNGDTIEYSTEMIGKLARHYGIPFIDMYHLSGFNQYNFGSSADNNFGYDKVHPSILGVKRVSNILINELLKMQEYID